MFRLTLDLERYTRPLLRQTAPLSWKNCCRKAPCAPTSQILSEQRQCIWPPLWRTLEHWSYCFKPLQTTQTATTFETNEDARLWILQSSVENTKIRELVERDFELAAAKAKEMKQSEKDTIPAYERWSFWETNLVDCRKRSDTPKKGSSSSDPDPLLSMDTFSINDVQEIDCKGKNIPNLALERSQERCWPTSTTNTDSQS